MPTIRLSSTPATNVITFTPGKPIPNDQALIVDLLADLRIQGLDRRFLLEIRHRRTLTEPQLRWLRDIARRSRHPGAGNIPDTAA